MTSYPVQQLVGGRAIESHRESIPPSPAAMGGVVAAAMDGAEIGRVIGTAVAFGHQTVVGVGAGLAADVADAAIAGDHRSRELALGSRRIACLQRLPARCRPFIPFRAAGPERPRFPWHIR
jgi:hypothetical protein